MQTNLFIDGEFVKSLSGERIPVLNAFDNSLLCEVEEARAEDVDRAVEAAAQAFPAWRALSATDRGRYLLRLADRIEQDSDNLARLESQDTGHPSATASISMCREPPCASATSAAGG